MKKDYFYYNKHFDNGEIVFENASGISNGRNVFLLYDNEKNFAADNRTVKSYDIIF